MKKKFRRHRQERFQHRNRNRNHNKNLKSFALIIAVKEKLFKLFDINYFHFNLSNEHEENDYIIVSNKNTIFRDVYMFMQQVKRVVSVKNVLSRLYLCLRNFVMI